MRRPQVWHDARVSRPPGDLASYLPLLTDRLELRLIAVGDAPAVHAYRGRTDVAAHLPHPALSPEQVEDQVLAWSADPNRLSVAMRRRGQQQVIGDVQLMVHPVTALAPSTSTERDAALGYALHPGEQGHGLATEAVHAVVGHALATLGLRRVHARVFTAAAASSRLLARVGFRHEGTERAVVLGRDGHWLDDELWAVLAQEWPPGAP